THGNGGGGGGSGENSAVGTTVVTSTGGAGGSYGGGGGGCGTVVGTGANVFNVGTGGGSLIAVTYNSTTITGNAADQPQPPQQPRFNRRGAARGRGEFAFPPLWQNDGWEIQSPHAPVKPRPSAGAMIATGLALVLTPPTLLPPHQYGWEVQPPQPPHPRPEKSGALARGDDGNEAPIQFQKYGWELQPVQPPHLRSEKSGAISTGDNGIEARFIAPTVVYPE